MKTAILIIAAGASRRLGQPKQLLNYKNTFLLNYIIQECKAGEIGDIYVVLGANQEQIKSKLSNDISIFINDNWQKGMGNSIAFGMQNIINKDYDSVIIAVGDQPFFSRTILQSIIGKQSNTNSSIVISKYEKGRGTPCFFNENLFSELIQLKGDIGAKPIIKKYKHQVEMIDFPKGNIDIDTIDDLKYLT
ncbi:MAG: NTP transferase domain-containing protein [Saprospiraceae bacterium]